MAIRPSEAALQELLALQADLDQGRVVPEENLHVTLAFLDEQSEATLGVLHEVLADIRMNDVALTFSGVDARGGRSPALIWAGIDPTEPLVQLHSRVRGAAHQAGIALPRKRFRPHVTLARIGRGARVDRSRLGAWLARHGTFAAGPFPVASFCLYRSQLAPGGSIYEILAEYPMDGSASVSGE
ncbi:MAG: RNA 2',3'-cyclic phosphodiesterase [Pseudomonadota bacterium]